MMRNRIAAPPIGLAVAAALVALAGCDGNLKRSEQAAVDELDVIAPTVKDDVEQIRRGLPQGAARIGAVLDADALGDPAGLQRSITAVRGQVKDLGAAKSTFFAIADRTGIVLRSGWDPDLLAGKSLVQAFPTLAAALPAGGAHATEAFGEMPELRGTKVGADLAWIVAHPLKDAVGAPAGLFVTGWSFRRFASQLDELAKVHMAEGAAKLGKKSVPVVFVFVIKRGTAYGSTQAPDVNAQTVGGLDLVQKTAAGPYRANLEISGRGFGIAARRTPELGDDAAVAVLISEP